MIASVCRTIGSSPDDCAVHVEHTETDGYPTLEITQNIVETGEDGRGDLDVSIFVGFTVVDGIVYKSTVLCMKTAAACAQQFARHRELRAVRRGPGGGE